MMNFLAKPSEDTSIPDQHGFRRRMLLECQAMARYALAAGLKVEPGTIEALDALLGGWREQPQEACSETLASLPIEDRPPAPQPQAGPAENAAEAGVGLRLAQVHTTLSQIIRPAQPGTVLLMERESKAHPFWSSFGSVPLVRKLLAVALLSLFLLCGVSMTDAVNEQNMSMSWFHLDGLEAVYVELFLISAAAVGASFANLSAVKSAISGGTYDTRDDSDYWIRLVLGMTAGIILSEIIFGMISGAPAPNPADGSTAMPGLTRMSASFLGGYGAAQVQTLLDNLSASIGALFGGAKPAPAASAQGLAVGAAHGPSSSAPATGAAGGAFADTAPPQAGGTAPPQTGGTARGVS